MVQRLAYAASHGRMSALWSIAVSSAAFALLLATLNGPGLTIDEPINVGHGKTMVAAFTARPWKVFDAETVFRVWRRGHEHPPLARWLIGWCHRLFDPAPNDAGFIAPKSGRAAWRWHTRFSSGSRRVGGGGSPGQRRASLPAPACC